MATPHTRHGRPPLTQTPPYKPFRAYLHTLSNTRDERSARVTPAPGLHAHHVVQHQWQVRREEP